MVLTLDQDSQKCLSINNQDFLGWNLQAKVIGNKLRKRATKRTLKDTFMHFLLTIHFTNNVMEYQRAFHCLMYKLILS